MKFSHKLIIFPLLLCSTAFAANEIKSRPELKEFQDALAHFRNDQADTIKTFRLLLNDKKNPEEYVRFYLGQALIKAEQYAEAEAEFKKVLTMNTNAKMSIESSKYLAEISLKKKNFAEAKKLYNTLERRARNTEDYPEIIYNLALVEKNLKNNRNMCVWLERLYEKYPAYPPVANWGYDLASNEFDGTKSGCKATHEEFKVRVRYLLWAGLDSKAQGEIDILKKQLAKDDKFLADKFQAQFYMQEGEVVKAFQLLKPYYEANKSDLDFILLFANAAARAGEVQSAVGSYYAAYKLSSKSKTGRNALYQSAFLSYQYQDYDGAARRFSEFIKVNPTSGLVKDSQWHLAWLQYLKGDYIGSYSSMAKLSDTKRKNRKKWRAFPQDRLDYWMAMSLFRQGKLAEAKPLFEKISQDPLFGYYSIAATARLKKIEVSPLLPTKLAETKLPIRPRIISRFFAGEYLVPMVEDPSWGLDSESEDNLVMSQYTLDDEKIESEEEGLDESEVVDNGDLKMMEVAEGTSTETAPLVSGDPKAIFGNSKLLDQFMRARKMIGIGENEWARWDLYDIERKTSKRDYLQILMSEYHSAEQFNRSAYIAQINFGAHRASQGLGNGKNLWEKAYPRAYDKYVDKYSAQFKVPEELIWGIMRAETNYKRDAISPVGALGLMQVMPVTGYKVAELLKDNTFKPHMLLEPDYAVKIGSRYLRRLMDHFEGAIPFVAAGYNAGPHRVKSWVSNFGNLETDEFIEHIPFLETRNYVKRVVSNSHIYSQLYNKKVDLFPYLAGPLPVKFKNYISGKENWDDI